MSFKIFVKVFVFFQCCILIEGLYPLKSVIRNYERDYGFVFDAPSLIQQYYQNEDHTADEQFKIDTEINNPDVHYAKETNHDLSNLISRGVHSLAHNIAEKILNENEKRNIFSPISIASSLMLLMLGADGLTHQELMEAFGFNENPKLWKEPLNIHYQFGLLVEQLQLKSDYYPLSNDNDGNSEISSLPVENADSKRRYYHLFRNEEIVELANALFIQKDYSICHNYKDAIDKIYKNTEIKELNFRSNNDYYDGENIVYSAQKYINKWVERKTHGKVNEIIQNGGINQLTNVIIVNTLYFRALWEDSFINGATWSRQFYPNGRSNKPVMVETMANGGEFPYYDSEEYECRILGLPYKGGQTTMYIILPYNSDGHKLKAMQKRLKPEVIEDLLGKLELKSTIVTLPKMHLESSFNLKDILSEIGLKTLFNGDETDLSLMFNVHNGQEQWKNHAPQHETSSLTGSLSSSSNIEDNKMNHFVDKNGEEISILTRFGKSQIISNNEYTHDNKRSEGNAEDRGNYENPFMSQKKYHGRKSRIMKRSTMGRLRSGMRSTFANRLRGNIYVNEKPIKNENQKNLKIQRSSNNVKAILSDILHKVDLTINESGSEGSATTIAFFSRQDIEIEFRVDSPFLFFIQHDLTKLPLFYGAVINPV